MSSLHGLKPEGVRKGWLDNETADRKSYDIDKRRKPIYSFNPSA